METPKYLDRETSQTELHNLGIKTLISITHHTQLGIASANKNQDLLNIEK